MKSFAIRLSIHWWVFWMIPCAAFGQLSGTKLAIGRESLCVTEGAVDEGPKDGLSVNTTKMRAYVNAWTLQSIQAHFTYLGPTVEVSRLGSGETRIQFGLKLRAENACNLVYAMWRIEPESKIVVSIKRNPSQSRSSECGNRGYQNVKPRRAVAVPVLRPGDSHNFSAEIAGGELHVSVDNAVVWEGSMSPEALDMEGPVGIRSDNARLTLELKAGPYVGKHPDAPLVCKQETDASD